MNHEVAKKWAAALKSGNYCQGRGELCSVNEKYYDEETDKVFDGETTYCCLGVLCEIYRNEVGDMSYNIIGDSGIYDYQQYELPERVRDWAGMVCCEGTYYKDGDKFTLVDHNDEDYYNFDKIADIILENKDAL